MKTGTDDATGTNTLAPADNVVAIGVWEMVYASYDDARATNLEMRIIDEGSSYADAAHSGNVRANAWTVSICKGTAYASTLDGLAAEAAIWNISLSDAETIMIDQGLPALWVRSDALEGYWPLYSTAARDFSGKNRHGTNSGAATADHSYPGLAVWYGLR